MPALHEFFMAFRRPLGASIGLLGQSDGFGVYGWEVCERRAGMHRCILVLLASVLRSISLLLNVLRIFVIAARDVTINLRHTRKWRAKSGICAAFEPLLLAHSSTYTYHCERFFARGDSSLCVNR